MAQSYELYSKCVPQLYVSDDSCRSNLSFSNKELKLDAGSYGPRCCRFEAETTQTDIPNRRNVRSFVA